MSRSVLTTAVCLGVAAGFGCSSEGRVKVEGTVTYEGQPIPKGAVVFTALEGQNLNSGAPITDGKFEVDDKFGPKPGRYRVMINWTKPTGKKYRDTYGMQDEYVEGLPDKYNSKSDIEVVFTRGTNTLTYDLTK